LYQQRGLAVSQCTCSLLCSYTNGFYYLLFLFGVWCLW